MAQMNIGGLQIALTLDDTDLKQGEVRASQSLKKIEGETKRLGERMAAVGDIIKKSFIGALAGLTVGLVKAASHQTEIYRLAQSLGATVEELSRLEYAAGTAGVKTEQFAAAITTLNKNLDIAAGSGAGPAAQALEALGISATTASGELQSLPSILGAIADKFAQYQDGAGKAAIAAALFGDAGTKLIPLLNQGSAGIDELKRKADELGLTLGTEAAKRANDFSNAMSSLGQVATASAGVILQELTPTLQMLADHFTGSAEKSGMLASAAEAVSYGFKTIISVGQALFTTLELLGKMIGTVGAAMLKVAQFEFTEAIGIMKAGAGELNTIVANAQEFQKKLWSEWATNITVASEDTPKKMAPIISSIDTMTGSMEGFRDVALDTLQQVIDSPTATVVEKIKAIEDATRAGAIGFYEMGEMIRQVNQAAADQMDQLLSMTSQTLSAVFKESKGAAIAQALINTYQGITKALATLPPPASYAAAALVAAQGFAQVASIRSTQSNGAGGGRAGIGAGSGSSGGSGGGSGGPSQQQPQGALAPSQTLTLQGIRPDAFYSGEAIRNLAEALISYQRDGGRIILGET